MSSTLTGVALFVALLTPGFIFVQRREQFHSDGKPRRTDQPTEVKGRWAKSLNDDQPDVILPEPDDAPASLFDEVHT